ncbi:MAG: hypothetical protein IJ802_01225, partial [Kiritimatiellae bacterium]|nr:hypothetical protein [Kiritimatiellia bacterium]
AIRRRYGAWGYPSVIILDGEGEVLSRPPVHADMGWKEVFDAIEAKREEPQMPKPSISEAAAFAVYKTLMTARVMSAMVTPGKVHVSAAPSVRKREWGVEYPAAAEARVETEYFENVAIPFYNRFLVDAFAADPAAGGKHHDEILALRRKFAEYIALERSEIMTGEELKKADALWNKERVQDPVVGMMYLISLRTWEREVNKNWARTLSECRKFAAGDVMMEMLVEFHNARNGGTGAKRWENFEAAFVKVLSVFAEADELLLLRYAKCGDALSHETIDAIPHPRMRAIAKAEKLMEEAFASRGDGWASQVTPEGRDGYKAKMAEGVQCLKDALAEYPDDALLLSRLAYYAGCSSAAGVEAVETCMKACRSSLDFSQENASQMLHFLTSRWGGSTDLLREFAIRAGDDVRTDSMFAFNMAREAVKKIRRFEIENVCPETFYSECYTDELASAIYRILDAYIAGERGPHMPDADFFRIAALEFAVQRRNFDRAFAYAKGVQRHPKCWWDFPWPFGGLDSYVTEFSVRAFLDGRHMDRFVEAMRTAEKGTLADRRKALETYREILAAPDADGDEKCFVSLELYRQRTFLDLAEKGEADLTPTFEFGEADNIWAKPKDKGNGWIQWHSARHDLRLMSRVAFPYAGSVYSGEVKLAGEGAKFEFSPCRNYSNADALYQMPYLTLAREGSKTRVRLYSATALPPRRGRTRRLTWDDFIAAEMLVDTEGFHTWEMDLGDDGRDFSVRIDGEEFCRIPFIRMLAATKEYGKYIAEGNYSYPVWTVRKDAFFRNPRIRIAR